MLGDIGWHMIHLSKFQTMAQNKIIFIYSLPRFCSTDARSFQRTYETEFAKHAPNIVVLTNPPFVNPECEAKGSLTQHCCGTPADCSHTPTTSEQKYGCASFDWERWVVKRALPGETLVLPSETPDWRSDNLVRMSRACLPRW